MYCSTLSKQPEKQTSQYVASLTEGIKELTTMMNVRQQTAGETDCKDKSTQQLLQKGIFSDTHVLALMYAGEMSYWLLSHMPSKDDDLQHSQLVEQCKHFLSTYVAVTEGPLKQHGWSTEKAKQILSEISS